MKIAIVTHVVKREDGQGRVNFELARELIRHNHSVFLITSEVDQSLLDEAAVAWIPVRKPTLPTYLLRDQIFACRTSLILLRLRGCFDIVVVNGFVTWSRSDINLVHFVHDAWAKSPSHPARSGFGPNQLYQWLYTGLNVRLERFGFHRCALVVAVSQLVRTQLIESGVPHEKIEVIANGVDVGVFRPATADRARFGLPENRFLCLFAGDLRSSRKNLETVLRAMVQMPDMVLAVAGNASGSVYPNMAVRLGIAGRVYFLGLVTEMSRLMCAVDAFVFPSRFEPFGLVVLEASACGLPVVTSSAVGACDVLAPEGIILVDPPDDVGGFVRALKALLDPGVRARMGSAAHSAAQRFSWETVMSRYHEIISKVTPRQAES
jgi:glycosyltransferase involved in cell wall biosynthesis